MATEHKKYGGSAIKLTGFCGGSVKAKAGQPKTTSESADRGTRIHGWLEQYLKGDLTPPKKKLTDSELKEAQIGAAAGFEIKTVIAQLGMQLSHFNVEKMMDFIPGWHPEDPMFAGGTPDLWGYKPGGDLVVIDLKTGRTQVSAHDSEQLLFYGCCALNSIDPFDRATLHSFIPVIVQTQDDSLDVVVRIGSPVSMPEMAAHEAMFRARIEQAEANPDLRTPGDHCIDLWCDARTTCQEHLNYLDKQSAGLFNRLLAGEAAATIKAELTTGEKLAQILNAGKAINDVIKEAKAQALSLAQLHPGSVPGYTTDTGLSDRAWEDAKKAEKEMKLQGLTLDEINPRKMASPAQVEEIVKAKVAEAKRLGVESTFQAFTLPATKREATKPRLVKGEPKNVFANFAPEEANAPKELAVTAAATTG